MVNLLPNSRSTAQASFNSVADAQKAANDLANATNIEVTVNAIINGKQLSIPGYPTKDASDQNASIKILTSKVGSIANPAKTAEILARAEAAKRGITTTVEVAGVKYTAQPPARPTDLKNAAAGNHGTVAGTGMTEPNLRKSAIAALQQAKKGSGTDENDAGGKPVETGSSSFEKTIQYNIPREASGKISTLEGLMDGIDSKALSGVLGSLPGSFKSLLPTGSLPGLLKQSSVPINDLLNIASGNAIGSAAGQALSSVSNSIPLASSALTNTVSSLSLGSVNNRNNTKQAVLSTVMGAALTNIVSGNSVKISVPHINVGAMANLSTDQSSYIPINLFGSANSSAFNNLSSLMNSAIGTRVSIVPTNLSIGSLTGGAIGVASALGSGVAGAVSGVAQKLSSFDTANLFSPSQLTNALPGNISNLLSSGRPPRTYNPSAMGISPHAGPFTSPPNDITSRRKSAPSQRTNLPREGAHPPQTPPSGTVMKNGQIDYSLVISPNGVTLGQLTKQGVKGGYELPPKGHLGLTLDQIVEGLKYIATNAVDPLQQNFGKAVVVNGFRGPGGSDYGKSDHCFGAAVDLNWNSAAKNYEIAQWAVKYIKDSFVYLVFQHSGDVGYVHVAAGPNQKYKYPYPFGTTFDDGANFKNGIQRPTWI